MSDQADVSWQSISSDPWLSRPLTPGSPGNVPAGGDLRLDIGWDRFEQLLAAIAHDVEGLNQIQFRRYGTSGQAQHGIDLAGRRPDGSHVVIQCKEYQIFTPADLRAAVEAFATGRRPFGAAHLIVAVSTETRTTQLADQLATLQDDRRDLKIELWGAEQINKVLRRRADVVARFWTRETAETFCTGAPPPGVAAPAPDRLRVSDQVLRGPLSVDGSDEQLAEADALRASDPAGAAETYRRLADKLDGENFTGHAFVMRYKQLDALTEAGSVDAAAALTAQLAARVLHEGDAHQGQLLGRRLDALVQTQAQKAKEAGDPSGDAAAPDVSGAGAPSTAMARHADLISAAVRVAQHPLNDRGALATLLRTTPPGLDPPDYQPLLVLLLGEMILADAVVTAPDQPAIAYEPTPPGATPATVHLAELDDLIASTLTQMQSVPSTAVDKDVHLRLRLLRASYDLVEREVLLTQARQQKLPRPHAALVLAAQARRDALDGSTEDALEHWRQAIAHAIHDGRTDDAAGWLYAIQTVNARYGPWTENINDEHLLAQALPKTGSGRLVRRVRDPETDAHRAALDDRPIEAIRAAHRWLADSIVTGDWGDEQAATNLLGDLCAANAEPDRAAACYEWAGETKKLTALAAEAGDRLLPFSPIGCGPWWQQASSLAALADQQDLIDDETAGHLLRALLDLVERGSAGELIDNPWHALTLQVTKTACAFAGRGTPADAQALLDLFAGDVARQPNHYYHHDTEHVQACQAIATHHPQLAWPALVRIFDLAEVSTYEAFNALGGDLVQDLLREPSPAANHWPQLTLTDRVLTAGERQQLRERLQLMSAEHYDAAVAVAALGLTDAAVGDHAVRARDRLLQRPEPTGHGFSGGTRMVPDSYLVTLLEPADQQACLEKMLTVAEDRREAASNRQEALGAASNLVIDQSDVLKADVHARSRAFVDGHQDGSAYDDQVTNPHPLSFMKVDLGPATLRASGLRLALCSVGIEQDKQWVRERAVAMLGDDDEHLARAGAVTLSRLGAEVRGDLDAALLVVHPQRTVRQLAAVIAAATPVRHTHALRALAVDPDSSVRTVLARRLHKARNAAVGDVPGAEVTPGHDEDDQRASLTIVAEMLVVLAEDVRHTVRRSAAGLTS